MLRARPIKGPGPYRFFSAAATRRERRDHDGGRCRSRTLAVVTGDGGARALDPRIHSALAPLDLPLRFFFFFSVVSGSPRSLADGDGVLLRFLLRRRFFLLGVLRRLLADTGTCPFLLLGFGLRRRRGLLLHFVSGVHAVELAGEDGASAARRLSGLHPVDVSASGLVAGLQPFESSSPSGCVAGLHPVDSSTSRRFAGLHPVDSSSSGCFTGLHPVDASAPCRLAGLHPVDSSAPGRVAGLHAIVTSSPGSVAGQHPLDFSPPGSVTGLHPIDSSAPGRVAGLHPLYSSPPGSVTGLHTVEPSAPGRVAGLPPDYTPSSPPPRAASPDYSPSTPAPSPVRSDAEAGTSALRRRHHPYQRSGFSIACLSRTVRVTGGHHRRALLQGY
ncbi:hypothetical protein E2562_023197 [Oryza meyeriana var. granulata]|uniref:Uncharacterized protein n=1 Tax=Oryza meyeriana var. granulata TaxID=110450 RepID=A0A6G1BZ45_9ORYZ|nr:hypothetical protein E2562_023197 [Oryza meyeriana var. granulata]